jgi:uncharacterized protein (TIGR02466 family)
MLIDQIFINFIARDELYGEKNKIDNKSIIEYAHKLKKENIKGASVSNIGGWQSQNINLNDEPVKPLFDYITKTINEIHKKVGMSESCHQVISEAWININGKGHANAQHSHAGGFFSGVYYMQCEENQGHINFINPIMGHQYTMKRFMADSWNEFNAGKWKVVSKTNSLIIFPSWLEHYVEPNLVDKERVSISFNTLIEKNN